MTVALDSSGTPASSTGNFNFVHTPSGTPRAVIIVVAQDVGATDEITSVSYGGVGMTRVGAVFHSTGETGAVYAYFLGAGIPTGPQTVLINVNGTASNKRPCVWALTAAKDTVVIASDVSVNSDSLANPAVTLALTAKTAWCGIVFFSGQDLVASLTPLANWTATLTQQWASNLRTAGGYRYNTIASADVSAGWTQTADDAVMIALAVTESFTIPGQLAQPAGVTEITEIN